MDIRVALGILVGVIPTLALGGWFGPGNYEGCVLEKMKGHESRMMSYAREACEKEFPYEKDLARDVVLVDTRGDTRQTEEDVSKKVDRKLNTEEDISKEIDRILNADRDSLYSPSPQKDSTDVIEYGWSASERTITVKINKNVTDYRITKLGIGLSKVECEKKLGGFEKELVLEFSRWRSSAKIATEQASEYKCMEVTHVYGMRRN